MDYKPILNEIKPNKTEQENVEKISNELINYINKLSKEESLNCVANLVGSVAKGTWLSGKSDIDIFINFTLDTPLEDLKEKGLYIAYKTSETFNGEAEEHYASHPYLTSHIDNFKIDFVPSYKINTAEELKSAVDRTSLHTKFIKNNLKKEQINDVLLLKRFMDCVGVYGSEFKVGGFAGYLCEILIIHYGSFEKTLKNVSNWKYGTKIDISKYNTSSLFNDPLIAIDPTDKNRNVGAALTLEKMVQFIISARNYLNSTSKEKFFYPLKKNREITEESLIKSFKEELTRNILVEFKIPTIPTDTLDPQLKKTSESIKEKLIEEDFTVYKSTYYSEKDHGLFIFQTNQGTLNKTKVQYGPKVWGRKPCENFKKSHNNNVYVIDDFLVTNINREFLIPEDYIEYVLKSENIHLIKVGKNLKDKLINTYRITTIEKYLKEKKHTEEFLNLLDDFLKEGQYLDR